MLQCSDLTPVARGPMVDGGPLLTSLGDAYAMLVDTDARWNMMMEGKWGISHSSLDIFVTKHRLFLIVSLN